MGISHRLAAYPFDLQNRRFLAWGPPAYYTPIGLGPLGGHPAYMLLTREGTH
jgi:hypothetical protein